MNFRQSSGIFVGLLILFAGCVYFFHLTWWLLLIPLMIYISKLVFGAIFIEQNFYLTSTNSLYDKLIPGNETSVCLTFDDGIHPEFTPRVLDILKKEQINAMFFIIGINIRGNEAILLRIKEEGHQIGNHSDTHDLWFDLKSSADMKKNILKMNERVGAIIGKEYIPVYFRPPYGVTNPNLAKAIKDIGLISVGWNLRSMDTVAKSKKQLLETLKSQTRSGSIVLLHDRCEITVNTLTDYIAFCKTQGFTFTTL